VRADFRLSLTTAGGGPFVGSLVLTVMLYNTRFVHERGRDLC
jgi:hypothetical protein